jgi:hypothetical protein
VDRQKPPKSKKRKTSKTGHDSYYKNASRNIDSENSGALKSMEENGMILAMSSQGSAMNLSPKNQIINNLSSFTVGNQMSNNFKNNRNFEKDTTNTGEFLQSKNYLKELTKDRRMQVQTPVIAKHLQSSGSNYIADKDKKREALQEKKTTLSPRVGGNKILEKKVTDSATQFTHHGTSNKVSNVDFRNDSVRDRSQKNENDGSQTQLLSRSDINPYDNDSKVIEMANMLSEKRSKNDIGDVSIERISDNSKGEASRNTIQTLNLKTNP